MSKPWPNTALRKQWLARETTASEHRTIIISALTTLDLSVLTIQWETEISVIARTKVLYWTCMSNRSRLWSDKETPHTVLVFYLSHKTVGESLGKSSTGGHIPTSCVSTG